MKSNTIIVFSIFLFFDPLLAQNKLTKNKLAAITSVNNHEKNLVKLSNQIWEHAETALLEVRKFLKN